MNVTLLPVVGGSQKASVAEFLRVLYVPYLKITLRLRKDHFLKRTCSNLNEDIPCCLPILFSNCLHSTIAFRSESRHSYLMCSTSLAGRGPLLASYEYGSFLRHLAAMILTDGLPGSLLLRLLMKLQPPAQFEVLAVVSPYLSIVRVVHAGRPGLGRL